MPMEPDPDQREQDGHDDASDGGLGVDDLAEGAEDLFRADNEQGTPPLQPDAPPPD